MGYAGAVLVTTDKDGKMRLHGKEAQVTDQQINIAIAEACGWTCLGQVEGCKPHGYPPDARKPTTKELIEGYGPSPWDVPDYCNDLNAMHEAEKVLTAEQRRSYSNCIFNLPVSECESNTFATAAQRAKAFLRTIGKWEEEL